MTLFDFGMKVEKKNNATTWGRKDWTPEDVRREYYRHVAWCPDCFGHLEILEFFVLTQDDGFNVAERVINNTREVSEQWSTTGKEKAHMERKNSATDAETGTGASSCITEEYPVLSGKDLFALLAKTRFSTDGCLTSESTDVRNL